MDTIEKVKSHLEKMKDVVRRYLPPDGIQINDAMSELIRLLDGPEERALMAILATPPAAGTGGDEVKARKHHPHSYEQRVLDSIAYIRGELEKGFYSPDKEPLEVIMYAAKESLK